MKPTVTFILILLFSLSAFGQTASQPTDNHGVTIVDKEWKFSKKVPNSAPSSIEYMKQQRAIINDSKRNQIRIEEGRSTTNDVRTNYPTSPTKVGTTQAPDSDTYVYAATLKNDKPKTIEEITWEYVFYDPNTKQEVGRRRFISKETIRPGKKKTLDERSPSPPTDIITLDANGNAPTGKYLEEIQIKSIKYSDGSVWEDAIPKKQNFAEAAR